MRRRPTVARMDTPTLLARTGAYWLVGQMLLITVIASAIPGGASQLVLAGFVTAYYDTNVFAIRLAAVPWTDPAVYISVQSLVQMLIVAAVGSALTTIARTNPWQHGVLPNSTAPGRDKPTLPAAPHISGPASQSAPNPAADPPPTPPGPASAAGSPPAPRPPTGPTAGPA